MHKQQLNKANKTSLEHAFQLKLDWKIKMNLDGLGKDKNTKGCRYSLGNFRCGKGQGGSNG